MSLQRLLLTMFVMATSLLLVEAQNNTACAAGGAISCPRPDDTTSFTGIFICRERYNLAYLDVVQTPLCVDPAWAGRTTDTCGCCGGGCPNPCFEPCPINGDSSNVGVYLYDWWAWRPRRICTTVGASLQKKQVNNARWACFPNYDSYFGRLFTFVDGEAEAQFSVSGLEGWFA